MNWLWDWLFGRDYELSLWIDEEELGKDKVIRVGKKQHTIVVPARFPRSATIRYRGIGRTKWGRTGDVYLHAWLNKGDDLHTTLWLSQSCARRGAERKILLDGRTVTMVVPPNCYDGRTIRLRGYGKAPKAPSAPLLSHPRPGNAYVRLRTYADSIAPEYGSFDNLSTDDMALEGWVYNRIDHVIQHLPRSGFPSGALPADQIADVYNASGWRGVVDLMVHHLGLDQYGVRVDPSSTLEQPGRCRKESRASANGVYSWGYQIEINERCLDNPFMVAAVMAHELCHVVCAERLHETPSPTTTEEEATLQVERTVDLLVFMFKVGEFQLRVARDQALTLGYFHQDVFERMHVIAERQLSRLTSR